MVDQSAGKWYKLHDKDCVKMLRSLQSSHTLVRDAVLAMDRDNTGNIEYAEFLGWWITNTSSTTQEVAQEVAWDAGSDAGDDGDTLAEPVSMADINLRFDAIERCEIKRDARSAHTVSHGCGLWSPLQLTLSCGLWPESAYVLPAIDGWAHNKQGSRLNGRAYGADQ